MSSWDKHYAGLNITASDDNGKLRPISRVSLFLDDKNYLTAGDDTGMEIAASCPHATQAMVNALLDKFRGYQYRMMSANDTAINQAAELGDGVTADGVYFGIARINDDGSGFLSVTAPGEQEQEDEYPMDGPIVRMLTQSTNKKIAETQSSIEKTAEEIKLEVKKTNESLAQVSITADKINWLVKSGDSSSNFTLTDKAIELVSDAINLTSLVTFTDLKNQNSKTVINGSNITTGTIQAERVNLSAYSTTSATNAKIQSEIKAFEDGLSLSVTNGDESSTITLKSGSANISSGSITFTGLTKFVAKDDIYTKGTTTIDGGKITAGSISADKIDVSDLKALNATIGGFTIGQSALYNGLSTLSGTSDGVYIGTNGIALGGGNFKVTSAGALTAKNGQIGGFTIGQSALYNGLSSLSGSSNGVYLGTDGIALGGGKFKVTSAGALTANSGKIGGWTIEGGQLIGSDGGLITAVQAPASGWWVFASGGTSKTSYEDYPFRVSKQGDLYCTSVNISGTFGGLHDGGTDAGVRLTSYCTGWLNPSGGYTCGVDQGQITSCTTGGTSLRIGNAGNIGVNGSFPRLYGESSSLYGGTGYIIQGPSGATESGNLVVNGSITCHGTKPRTMDTAHFGSRQLDAYETPLPTFSDYGMARLDGDGIAYIVIDPIFAETVDKDFLPVVFLTKYGDGDIWVYGIEHDTVTIKGTPGLKFAWETRYAQANAGVGRLRIMDFDYQDLDDESDFETDASIDHEFSLQNVDYARSGEIYLDDYERSLT